MSLEKLIACFEHQYVYQNNQMDLTHFHAHMKSLIDACEDNMRFLLPEIGTKQRGCITWRCEDKEREHIRNIRVRIYFTEQMLYSSGYYAEITFVRRKGWKYYTLTYRKLTDEERQELNDSLVEHETE